MSMQQPVRQRHKNGRITEDSGGAIGGSTLLSLSLFIILLAFFIVLNGISTYSQPKMQQAFSSLDITFSSDIPPSPFEQSSADERERQNGKGEGESMEEMQELLQSLLPGLSVILTEGGVAGNVMAVRMEKNRFDRLTPQLIPLFIRILNVKDGPQDYELTITSYVRDPLDVSARLSFQNLQKYRDLLMDKGLAADRISLAVDVGNPAFMMFQFDKRRSGDD